MIDKSNLKTTQSAPGDLLYGAVSVAVLVISNTTRTVAILYEADDLHLTDERQDVLRRIIARHDAA